MAADDAIKYMAINSNRELLKLRLHFTSRFGVGKNEVRIYAEDGAASSGSCVLIAVPLSRRSKYETANDEAAWTWAIYRRHGISFV